MIVRWMLWAQANSRVTGVAESFRGEEAQWGSVEWTILAAVVGSFVLACWLAAIWLRKAEQVKETNDPQALFHDLCKAHGLDRRSKSLLRRLVKEQRLEHPGVVFVESQRLAPERLYGWTPYDAAQVAQLRRRLFDEIA